MCNKIVLRSPFMLKYCFDRYKTQETRDKVDDDFLRALSWFVTSKVNKSHQNASFIDGNFLWRFC